MSLYVISASFREHGMTTAVACCFDPRVVLSLLREEFGDEIEIDPNDHAWKDWKAFVRKGDAEGAARVAENDAVRRGPNYAFRFPRADGQVVTGNAERYIVRIMSERPIPEPLRSRFLAFLRALPLVPFDVKSVRFDGNDETEA